MLTTKEKLEKVLEYLINESDMDGNKKAEALLHEAFLDIAKEINNKMLAEDGDYYYEEEDDEEEEFNPGDEEDEIEAEEFYGEDEMSDDEEVVDDLNGDLEGELDDVADGEADIEDVADQVEDLDTRLAELEAEFAELQGMDSEEPVDDMGDDMGDLEGSEEDMGEFNPEMMDDEVEESIEESDDEEEVDESEEAELDETEEAELDEEDFNLYDELDEALVDELKTVPMHKTGQHGEAGSGKYASTEHNTKSPTLSHGVNERTKGAGPVDINAGADGRGRLTTHKGYNREESQKVDKLSKEDHQTRNKSTDETEKKSKEGDNSALLNSKSDGFGSDNPDSVISGKTKVHESRGQGKKRAATRQRKVTRKPRRKE